MLNEMFAVFVFARITSAALAVIPSVIPIESAAGTTPPRIMYCVFASAAPLDATEID